MAMNENAATFLAAVASQAKGASAIDTLTYDGVIHEAGDWSWGEKEQFLGALSAQYADTIYTDASWTDKYGDIFFKNSDEFGAVVQIINIELPEIRANRSWETITSGTTTIGSNVVYLPVVKEQLTGGTSSWALPFALTGTQMNAAFKDVAGLRRFETYVRLAAENSARYHLAQMSAANRNNFILEKLAAGNPSQKVNVVNLVDEYNYMFHLTGDDALDANAFLANTNGCLRSVNRIFKKYKALMTDMTTMFSMQSDTKGKFVPDDRFAFVVLADFAGLLESELYSTTYHDTFVTLKGYREVPKWQGIRGESTLDLQFEDLSYIDGARDHSIFDTVETTGIEVSQSGVVALMCDSWAIMHTIVRHRMGVQRDDIKDITLYEHQYTDRYINNLMLNGLVFIVADPT